MYQFMIIMNVTPSVPPSSMIVMPSLQENAPNGCAWCKSQAVEGFNVLVNYYSPQKQFWVVGHRPCRPACMERQTKFSIRPAVITMASTTKTLPVSGPFRDENHAQPLGPLHDVGSIPAVMHHNIQKMSSTPAGGRCASPEEGFHASGALLGSQQSV